MHNPHENSHNSKSQSSYINISSSCIPNKMDTNGKKRTALLVGCTYPKSCYELHGCINDVVAMQKLLVDRLGFKPTSIQLLTDELGSKVKPTGANVKKALEKMVNEAKEGDLLFFHFSGHGMLIDEPFHKRVEAIVPCDYNIITDVEFRKLVDRLPEGATFTILSDSCHSGGLIDNEKEQIGPHCSPPPAQNINNRRPNHYSRSKCIPYASMLGHLAFLTNMPATEIGPHLTFLFGHEASPTFRLPNVRQNWVAQSAHGVDSGILLSGCQTDESCVDMPCGPGGKPCGAFSSAVQSILEKQRGPISNKELVTLTRKVLQEEANKQPPGPIADSLKKQHPCLYCSDQNVKAPFLLCNVGTQTN